MPASLAAAALATPPTRLGTFDLALIAVYLVGITIFGLRFRSHGQGSSLRSYFLAGNTIPWWAIALSIVSAETSTLTIISVPGIAFAGDLGFLQIVIGYMLGRVVVAALFLPRYMRGEMLTAYQLIDQRFGHSLHKVTAGLFLLTRAAAEGVRVFAVSIVVGIAIGTGDILSIAIISALTLLYTFEGGMAAVIWTDVVQMLIYIGGTVVAMLTLGSHVTGGWPHIHAAAMGAGKLRIFDFALNLTTTYTFWAGVLGGTFLTMASHGTDQLMVQRMLAARNLRESRLALLSSGVVIFVQFSLFLLIGTGLWVFYAQHPGTTFRTGDYIFPTFIVREMPVGIAGLLIAAILAAAMSNLSAALNSLSSTTVVDFYMRARPAADDRERALVSRGSTVLWACVLFAIALVSLHAGGKGHVVEIGLSIASVAYGCLLGVFLLGTLTRFATEAGATVGMVCGFALNLWLWQGAFPVHLGPLTIPHIAWTWYVLIGSAATFAIGSLASLVLRKQSPRTPAAKPVTLALLLLFWLSSPKGICVSLHAQAPTTSSTKPASATPAGFSAISSLVNDAIAQHKLPGAVVLIGRHGQPVFTQAYGSREYAGEPDFDGKPLAANVPMTEDTRFDMASLTKDLATATAIMQLYEHGKLDLDAPVEKYLPAFNPQHDPQRSLVTLRLLLTHFSGEAPDVNLKDSWGLATPDRAEGFHRALTTPLAGAPGAKFVYSDINFILLGLVVETVSGQREDDYAREHIFQPLGMTETRYLPLDRTCGAYAKAGAAVVFKSNATSQRNSDGTFTTSISDYSCPPRDWIPQGLLQNTAPTAHDDESKANPALNPDFDRMLRGTVNDPTARRMGGVAGHAGVFSTAHDVSLFAAALLEKLLHNTGDFPLEQSTLQLMIAPQQPGHSPTQIVTANLSEHAQIAAGMPPASGVPGLAPHYPSVKDQSLRGFGWDIDTGFSKPRGVVFPIGSFGHTGFTGTSLWMDPASDTYVILLANATYPRGNPPISNLRGQVATAAAQALGLQPPHAAATAAEAPSASPQAAPVQLGIDVLEAEHFAPLTTPATNGMPLRVGLLVNAASLDSAGRRTVDVLAHASPQLKLTTLFSPEHGLFTAQDTEHLSAERDAATGLPVTSLYGPRDSDKRPSHDQLKDLDAIVIDLQDAGVHFWTYESVLDYTLEAASIERKAYRHMLRVIVLDRPNPLGGVAVGGPSVAAGQTSYTGTTAGMPVRHGLTFGELARLIDTLESLHVQPEVVTMTNWHRGDLWADTGLTWTPPSPNLRTPAATLLYPALGLIEQTNVSVGRGTGHPFSFFGAGAPADGTAAWFKAQPVADYLAARHIPGIIFTATHETIADTANHYPFHGQTIDAVECTVTDAKLLNSPEAGLEILAALHHLYPDQFKLQRAGHLLANDEVLAALTRGDDPREIAKSYAASLITFQQTSQSVLLYH